MHFRVLDVFQDRDHHHHLRRARESEAGAQREEGEEDGGAKILAVGAKREVRKGGAFGLERHWEFLCCHLRRVAPRGYSVNHHNYTHVLLASAELSSYFGA